MSWATNNLPWGVGTDVQVLGMIPVTSCPNLGMIHFYYSVTSLVTIRPNLNECKLSLVMLYKVSTSKYKYVQSLYLYILHIFSAGAMCMYSIQHYVLYSYDT